jgi:CO/xanthine dehydrogenase Mo-binding subunit
MNAPLSLDISRRGVLAGGGALIVSFSLLGLDEAVGQAPAPAGAAVPDPSMLDSWLRIDAQGVVTVYTGRTEFGQGVKTAMIQLAAEELYLDPQTVKIVGCDTALTPNEGYTSGSRAMADGGVSVRAAAAHAREILLNAAAPKLGADASQLKLEKGRVVAPDGKSLSYGELVADDVMHVKLNRQAKLKDPKTYSVVGKPFARVDIPAKVTGGVAFLQDLRLPGMVHARVVRPPSYEARLRAIDTAPVEKLPGVLKVVRDGSYLAVIAEKEFQAITAMRALAAAAQWDEPAKLTDYPALYEFLQKTPSEDVVVLDTKTTPAPGTRTIEATYRRPFQMHGSIGPSCGVGHFQDGKLTVWAHNQGAYPLRQAVSELVKLPEDQIRCIHMEGPGCYGHNGADDAGGDAALLAMAFPGRPVRVQWMREDEHAWEPYGSAMVTKARVSLDASGGIVDWHYDVWSMAHSTRPGGAKSMAAAWYREQPLTLPPPRVPSGSESDGNRNSKPPYKLPSARVIHHHIKEMPLRVSALRSLGAYMNVFSIESLMDELAAAAGADPVEYRLRYLEDPRAKDVIKMTAERFGWKTDKLPKGQGRGFAYARYRNSSSYVAVAAEVEVDQATGAVRIPRVVAAADSGQAVSPDGIRNQIEGGILQSASWTLYEQVGFDKTRVTSRDWASYPILRFSAVPESLEVHVIDRPGQPFLGAGEASQGPAGAAIANAIAQAVGARLRDLPLTRDKVKAAMQI